MLPNDQVFIAGDQTLLGSALVRQLRDQGFKNLVGAGADAPNLLDAREVDLFFERAKPDYIIVAAGVSGGIQANIKYPADFMLDNLQVATHVVSSAFRHGTKKLLYLASSCSYPRSCPQPMKVESLMTGPLEPTNEYYALAKLAGMKLCQAYRQQYGANFIVGVPADAFGPGDDFSEEDSHVVAALLRRMHEAKLEDSASVVVWGSGSPKREFAFSDDVASACVFALQNYEEPEVINLGGGTPMSIRTLAETIKDVVGFKGELTFDTAKPDGMPIKLLDSDKLLSLGWKPSTPLSDALALTYSWYLDTLPISNGKDV